MNPVDEKTATAPVGIVGVGRSRAGLGPFLAGFLEKAGFVVAAVSGRSLDRAVANAEEIGRRLGHEVKAFASPWEVCRSGVAALVIASPAENHLEALQAAAETGLPTLCEKPLVHEKDGLRGADLIDTFAQKSLPLLENCPWPYVLPAFFQLHGPPATGPKIRIEMGLAPSRLGREMVQNTLSHLLSMIPAVVPIGPGAVVRDVSLDDPSCEQDRNVLHFEVASPTQTVEALLYLDLCAAPPRPAWFAIDGRRIDRRIGELYSINFFANGREVAVSDPVNELVKRFAALMRTRNKVSMDFERDLVRQRLDWYRQILGELK